MDNRSLDTGQHHPRPIRVASYLVCAALLWTLAVAGSLLWVLRQDRNTMIEDARIQARTAVAKDVVYRRWNAIRGGVFAQVSENTLPNPHLRAEGREITAPSGKTLTLVNPAYMTRQVHELEYQQSGVRSHITSVKPIRPQNAPDPWETEALKAFEGGAEEVSSAGQLDGQRVVRLMRPLKVEESCLKCHGFQGYEAGDVRGGISVAVPLAPYEASMRSQGRVSIFGHAVLWLLGMAGMGMGSLHLRRRVAERDHAETLLRNAKREAESASKAKSEFLANMSHEIRSPMTAILGFTENLLDANLDAQEKKEAVEAVRRNGFHLLTVINDILDLSKIEAGKLDVELLPCSPSQILDEIAATVRSQARAKNLTLAVECSRSLPARILADPTRLRQVLINVAANAVKFTTTGEVRLTASPVSVVAADGESASASAVQFEISDTGIGMTPAEMSRLFQPFTQADGSVTRRFGGTGLGLAISKRLVELMGGSISLESVPGKGTTIRVTMPVGEQSSAASPIGVSANRALPVSPIRSAASSLVSTRILLAEDGPDNQRLIVSILKRAGAEVSVAEDGHRSLELARIATERGMPYDVVLMDMHMPVMDGYTATRLLRENGYAGPVIALTAHAMSDARTECLAAGCSDFVTKPIDRDALIATIIRHIRQTVVEV